MRLATENLKTWIKLLVILVSGQESVLQKVGKTIWDFSGNHLFSNCVRNHAEKEKWAILIGVIVGDGWPWLRALDSFSEDAFQWPAHTWLLTNSHSFSDRGFGAIPWPLWAPGTRHTHSTHKYMKKTTHAHKMNKSKRSMKNAVLWGYHIWFDCKYTLVLPSES